MDGIRVVVRIEVALGVFAEFVEYYKRKEADYLIDRACTASDHRFVGTQTPGLGPYTTNRDIPTLGAGGETAGIGRNFTVLRG